MKSIGNFLCVIAVIGTVITLTSGFWSGIDLAAGALVFGIGFLLSYLGEKTSKPTGGEGFSEGGYEGRTHGDSDQGWYDRDNRYHAARDELTYFDIDGNEYNSDGEMVKSHDSDTYDPYWDR